LIDDLRLERSARRGDQLRLSVRISYPDRRGGSERAWYEVPAWAAQGICQGGDPWLLTFLPLAVTLGLPIETDLPVDPRLLDNVRALMDIWAGWYQSVRPIRLRVGTHARDDRPQPERTGLFFSGGTDSFYTLLHSEETGDPSVDDLLVLHGFDVDIGNDRAYANVLRTAHAASSDLDKTVVPIATNVRETRFREANWSELAAGCVLGGAGLAMGHRYRRLLISGTLAPGHFRPHATHPDTDPLFSTSRTTFLHLGADLSRIPKLQYLHPHPIAMRNLRVCYESTDGGNCGRCLKCVVVMAMLELIGALGEATTFGTDELDLGLIRRTYISQGSVSFRQIKEYALETGRQDIADAVDGAFARTRRIDRWLQLRWLRRARERWQHDPWLRRTTARLRPWLWRAGRRLNRLLP
jgi:hypothetical protein